MRISLRALPLALLGAACSGAPSSSADRLVRIAVSPPSLVLLCGQSAQLRLVGMTAAGDTLPVVSARWASSNPTAVSVDSTGLVKAIDSGAAQIRATVPDLSATADVFTAGPACGTGRSANSRSVLPLEIMAIAQRAAGQAFVLVALGKSV